MSPTDPRRRKSAPPDRSTTSAGRPPSDTRPPTPAPQGTQVDHRQTPPSVVSPPNSVPAVPGYEMLGLLGEGGMGVVYRARQLRLNRVVALKMVLGGGRVGPKEATRFRAEAVAMASVRHPNVAQVFEAGEADGRSFLAMEYLPGGTLADRLAGETLAPRKAAALVGRIARGVQAAHEQQIVHRDLKPSNVLFDAAGEPKVADFGLAKRAASDLTATQAVMGTPSYMAPEQAGGRTKFVGPPADVWALGVVLYECLTGARPFAADETDDLLYRIRTEAPAPPRRCAPKVPPDLERVCLKCLEKDPADRYPTARELADDLARFARGEPVSVRRPGVAERVYKWARRNPTRAAAAALVAFSVAVTGLGSVIAVLWRDAVWAQADAEFARDELAGQRDALATQKAEADRLRGEADAARLSLARGNYFRAFDLGWRAYLEGNGGRAWELLAAAGLDHHGWEWDFVTRRVNGAAVRSDEPAGRSRVALEHNSTADGRAGSPYYRQLDGGVALELSYTGDGRHLIGVTEESRNGGTWVRVRVWDAETGRPLRNLPEAGVLKEVGVADGAVLTPGGRYALFSTGVLKQSMLGTATTPGGVPKAMPVPPGAMPQPSAPRAHPESPVLVVETATGREVGRFRTAYAVQSAEETPDPGRLLVTLGNESVVTPRPIPRPDAAPNELFLLDARSGRRAVEFRTGGRVIRDAHLVLGGREVWAAETEVVPSKEATGGAVAGGGAASELVIRLRAWDAATGKERALGFPTARVPYLPPRSRWGRPPVLVPSPDGTVAAAVLGDGVGLIDLKGGEVTRTLTPPAAPPNGGPAPAGPPAARPEVALGSFDRAGTTVGVFSRFPSGEFVLTAFDTRTGKSVGAHTGVDSWEGLPRLGPDGRLVALPTAGEPVLTELTTGRRWYGLAGSTRRDPVPPGMWGTSRSLTAFHPDGRRVAVTTDGSRFTAWDLDRPERVVLTGVAVSDAPVGYAADGGQLLFAPRVAGPGEGRPAVTAFDTQTGLAVPAGPPDGLDGATFAFVRDGRPFVAASTSGPDGVTVRVRAVGAGEDSFAVRLPVDAVGPTGFLLWHPGGRKLLTFGGGLRQWDAGTGREEWRNPAVPELTLRHEQYTYTEFQSVRRGAQVEYVPVMKAATRIVRNLVATVSPNGGVIAVHITGNGPVTVRPGEVTAVPMNAAATTLLLDAASGRERATLPAEDAPALEHVFAPDGSRVAVVGGDGVTVYDAGSGRRLFRVRTPGAAVRTGAFTPDGTRLASGGVDGGVSLWDARDGQEVFAIPVDVGGVGWLGFHPDGSQLAVVGENNKVVLLNAR